MQIKEVMTTKVESVLVTDNLQMAAEKMRKLRIGSMPVYRDNEVAGMLTDRDIAVRGVARGVDILKTKVSAVMTPMVYSCTDDMQLEEAIRLMEEKKVRRLMVRNSEGEVVGILSLGDLLVKAKSTAACGVLTEIDSERIHVFS